MIFCLHSFLAFYFYFVWDKEIKAKTVYFDLSTFESAHIDKKAQMITEGAIIGEYAFDKYISKKKSSKKK